MSDANFVFESVQPHGRGEGVDGGAYTFRPLVDIGSIGRPPFVVTAESYTAAVAKLQSNIIDAVVAPRLEAGDIGDPDAT